MLMLVLMRLYYGSDSGIEYGVFFLPTSRHYKTVMMSQESLVYRILQGYHFLFLTRVPNRLPTSQW